MGHLAVSNLPTRNNIVRELAVCGTATRDNYNGFVARGWESKSVEAQQAEASDKSGKPSKKLSLEEAATRREQENLRLARQRILQQLGAATNERHKSSLQAALAELDEKLKRLGFLA